MRKIILGIVLTLSLTLNWAGMALAAASITTSPVTVKVTAGDMFNIDVYATTDKNGFTAMASLYYPGGVVAVDSWNFSPDVMPIRQPGYDTFDNNTGILTRTAGFPGGFTGKKYFGRATFKAVRNGTATISISGESFILDETNANVITDRGTTNVTVADKKVVPIATTTEQQAPKTTKPEVKPEIKPIQPVFTLEYSSQIEKDFISQGDSLIVLTNIKNTTPNNPAIASKVVYTIYGANGAPISTLEVPVKVVTESATAQKLGTEGLPAGKYSLVSEIVYDNQKDVQKFSNDFIIREAPKVSISQSMLPWVLVLILAVLCFFLIKRKGKRVIRKTHVKNTLLQ